MTRFDGREDDLSLDGEVATATVGVDVRTAKWVAGVAVSHSAGDGGYEAPAADDSGTLDSALTSVTPYARFALNDRVSLWGVLGQGGGNLTLRQDRTGESIRASLDMSMAALGLRGVVLPAERANGFELAVRTDAMAVWTDSDAAGDMLAAETETSRLRLTLEGSRAFEAGDGGSLVPTLELGLRHDDGDAERGFGLELGARLAYAAPRRRPGGRRPRPRRARARGRRLRGPVLRRFDPVRPGSSGPGPGARRHSLPRRRDGRRRADVVAPTSRA